MARQDYYPDYYLKKRQRDAVFNRVWKTVIVVVIVIFGVSAGYLLYKQIVEPRRQPSDNTSALAGLKGDLEAKDRLQNAENLTPAEEVDQTARELAQETKLEEIAFVQSFPEVHISVSGSNEPVKREGAVAAEQEPAAEDEPEDQAAEPTKAEDKPAAVKEEPAKPAPKEEAKPEKKPAGDQEQPKKPAPAAGSSGYEFKIYAGSYGSQEAADEAKRGLGGLGLTGKIIKNGADYNLLVGTLSDFEAALALRTKLEGSGYSGSFVTRKTR